MKNLDYYYFYMGISCIIKAIHIILCYNPLHFNKDFVMCNYSPVVSITLIFVLYETPQGNTQSLCNILEEAPILCPGNVSFLSECRSM